MRHLSKLYDRAIVESYTAWHLHTFHGRAIVKRYALGQGYR